MSATTSEIQGLRTAPVPGPVAGRLFLPVVLSGSGMVVLDIFIVNAAIPAVERDFHAAPTSLEWLVTGYNLAFAAAMITGGRLGDCFGRRRVSACGLAAFTEMSVLCGVAGGTAALIAARAGQGLAAAALVPRVSAIVSLTYQGAARARAHMFYAPTLCGAAVAGQIIGGGLIAADVAGLGWRAASS
ncbi:MFS transporter [Pseudofrankia sp. DC12]|uniref:MFS transporter n=1 Tax=Pseudofrankia sp. DC12 TaxID=683315 RepID=UPI000696FA6A|nr:MFS transporter [Pseudofrankia sp. DC12]